MPAERETVPVARLPSPARRAAPALPAQAGRVGSVRPWWRRWLRRGAVAALVLAGLAGLGMLEARTSWLQSRLFSRLAAQCHFRVEAGPGKAIRFPRPGPFDERRGYSRLPRFLRLLTGDGFVVSDQARQSKAMIRLLDHGINPPYREPVVAGLTLRSTEGWILFDARPAELRFEHYQEIPPLVVEALLFIENRELGEPANPRRNPTVEWDRFGRAALVHLGSQLGLRLPAEGGSTLAVQLEKYRHSPGGRTESGMEKLRQIASASLKAYRLGTDTRLRRRELVLEYLNTMPLGAAPGFGELHGLAEGLYARFGRRLDDVSRILARPGWGDEKAATFKQVLVLLLGVKAPSFYFQGRSTALDERLTAYLNLLAAAGILSEEGAQAVARAPLAALPRAPEPPPPSFADRKGVNLVRQQLTSLLEVDQLYDLDRLDLTADTTLALDLQRSVQALFRRLSDRGYLYRHDMLDARTLATGDPAQVVYSLTLFERTPAGNLARVHADSLDQPFDVNLGTKLELGSTGKLRTLAHYLDLVATLRGELAGRNRDELAKAAAAARDPLTRWVAERLAATPDLDLETLLAQAMERRYSASPAETFFTAGGLHAFSNFDPEENDRVMSLAEATWTSTNLVFVRLMRDLVAYHAARLVYDAGAVLADPRHPDRRRLVEEEADEEDRQRVLLAFRRFHGLGAAEIEARMLAKRAALPRAQAALFLAWHPDHGPGDLEGWLFDRFPDLPEETIAKLGRLYGAKGWTLLDSAYLLHRHPVDLWVAGELARNPDVAWQDLEARSRPVRSAASQWLFQGRSRRAQERLLRIRIEKDAFARMTPDWQRLGYSFDALLPSLATALGASGDRPSALADLMGILVNEGVRKPLVTLDRLRFAAGTPYETGLVRDESARAAGERVLPAPVARVLLHVLAGVVEKGTARRLTGAFLSSQGEALVVGGKTGSGDNRVKTFAPGGRLLDSKAVNRTATFAFFIGDRFFGVIAAYVPGPEAETYRFTSALPVTVLRELAPVINQYLQRETLPEGAS